MMWLFSVALQCEEPLSIPLTLQCEQPPARAESTQGERATCARRLNRRGLVPLADRRRSAAILLRCRVQCTAR
eukprot:3393148-Rhodomonas_salina.1